MFVPEYFAALGLSSLANFIFGEVLKDILKGTLEDYVKDFFKSSINDAVYYANDKLLQHSASRGLKEFLELFLGELEFCELSRAEIRDSNYTYDLEKFLKDETVLPILGKAFERKCRAIDTERLESRWQELGLTALPGEFSWQSVADQYLRKIKVYVKETPELARVLELELLEDIADSTKRSLGIQPNFDLLKYRESLLEQYGKLKLESIDAAAVAYQEL
jgi:hypothetical protein